MKALHWFTKAAQQGDSEIQELLVKFISRTKCKSSPNYVKAYAWANVLAEKLRRTLSELDGLRPYPISGRTKRCSRTFLLIMQRFKKRLIVN